jgi:dipeptidyl-peptidase-4
MNKLLFLLFFVLPISAISQKKQFTFQQLFKGKYPAVFNGLPNIVGWADDDHYLEIRNSSGKQTYYSVDALTGKASVYTGPATEPKLPEIKNAKNITASPDGKYVAYTRKNNLYVRDIVTDKETALTTDGSDSILNGYASWVYYEEILGRPSHYKAFWWSPDSKQIAYMHFDDSKVPVFPIYIADGQHGYLESERYPKAGDHNPEVKIGIVSIAGGATVWAGFNTAADQYFGLPQWTPDNELWVQWMNRAQNNLIVYHINKTDGTKKEIYNEKQDTWIALDDNDRFTFLSDNKSFIFKSDKDGWENLYLYTTEGKLINQITKGNFWGTAIVYLDQKNKQVYIRARKDNAARFDMYKVSFDGKTTTRLSSGNYSYDAVQMSPSGKYFVTVYSNLSTLPCISLFNIKGQMIREIVNAKGREFNDYALPETRLTSVRSSDNIFDLPVTITYPLHFDSTKKYPVWISVYGGPNAGTVYDRWKQTGGLTQWWAQQGIIQVSMDNRSSGHFGRKGMNYIYKQLGKWEIEDYMTCGRWLRSQSWADTAKIGITGGSFGWYITCMALTYGSEVFTHGIAQYSVTDWKLYDTHYTERYMRTPDENPQGYRITSVMTYADKYKGMLRIVHGSTDDNVHLQNSLQLINILEDMNKDFELMIYPGQRHGIGASKLAHDRAETCKFIYRYLLGKEMPGEFRD